MNHKYEQKQPWADEHIPIPIRPECGETKKDKLRKEIETKKAILQGYKRIKYHKATKDIERLEKDIEKLQGELDQLTHGQREFEF